MFAPRGNGKGLLHRIPPTPTPNLRLPRTKHSRSPTSRRTWKVAAGRNLLSSSPSLTTTANLSAPPELDTTRHKAQWHQQQSSPPPPPPRVCSCSRWCYSCRCSRHRHSRRTLPHRRTERTKRTRRLRRRHPRPETRIALAQRYRRVWPCSGLWLLRRYFHSEGREVLRTNR